MKQVTKSLSCKLANMSFVCACLIVLIHATPAPADGTVAWWWCHLLGREGICVIAVPYFFLASGFFLAGKMETTGWWKKEVLKRVKSLLVPFFFWGVVFLIFGLTIWLLKTNILHQHLNVPLIFTNPLRRLFVMTGLHPFADLGVLWYIRCLFALVVSAPLWYWLWNRCRLGVLLLLAVLHIFTSYLFGRMGWDFYSLFDRFVSMRGIFYFVLGIAFRLSGRKLALSCTMVWLCGLSGIAMVIGKNLLYLEGYCSAAFLLEALAVPFLMAIVFYYVPSTVWPQFLVGNAFAIFLMHNIFLSVLNMGFYAMGVHEDCVWQVPMMLMRLLWAVSGSVLIAALLRRAAPHFTAIVFGGR